MTAAVGEAGTPYADASEEMNFIASIIKEDNKNYHAWGYRQWALGHFSKDFPALWEQELTFVDTLIESDLRNNSAWNQRYWVLKKTADLTSQALLSSELDYAISYLKKAPNNPSPWAYIEGLVEPVGFAPFPQLRAYCELLRNPPSPAAGEIVDSESGEIVGAASPADHCVPALALLARILQSSDVASDVDAAKALCTELSSKDPIRERFWRWRAESTSNGEEESS